MRFEAFVPLFKALIDIIIPFKIVLVSDRTVVDNRRVVYVGSDFCLDSTNCPDLSSWRPFCAKFRELIISDYAAGNDDRWKTLTFIVIADLGQANGRKRIVCIALSVIREVEIPLKVDLRINIV
jgi:hypothetical protein